MKKLNSTTRFIFIYFLAVIILLGVSVLPIGELTDGKFKDFNLLGDLLSDTLSTAMPSDEAVAATESIDPDLLIAMQSDSANFSSGDVELDSMLRDSLRILAENIPDPIDKIDNGMVVIEDYTLSGEGLKRLRESISRRGLARIAVIGDSYIEGDIFTQNLRDSLQSAYGGGGVGYMNFHSEFPGFRKSVVQGGKGWQEHIINKKHDENFMGISGLYFTSLLNANATYAGTSNFDNTDSWQRSLALVIAPDGGTVKTKVGNVWRTYELRATDSVQAIMTTANTDNYEIKTSSPNVIGLGVWLDNRRGVSLDCMSVRGYAGMRHANINPELCHQMAKWVNYDLIIVEYGINAMSPGQRKYNVFSDKMVELINHLRVCYPGADILLMGIGDRGERVNGEIHTMVGSKEMIEAQRLAARKTRCLFWDTQAAMGGDDAIVRWAQEGNANKDYVHMTHRGGGVLGNLLFNAIRQNLNK